MNDVPVDLPNLRDVAGLVTADGRRVRAGILLRSALPESDDVVPDHLAWPPSVVIDLRSPFELQHGHPLEHLEPRLVNLPLLQALRPGRQSSETLAALYQVVLEDAAHLLVDLVHEIADADGPVLVHCAAGKDRTGVSVALVLRLLGVTHDDVMADYILTEQAAGDIDARLHRDDIEPRYPVSFYLVAPEALDGVLDIWDEHPGGVEGWFLEAGGDVDKLAQLRERMVE
jgi:rhodanese-related sulfurtransferase